eukprot:15268713-Heterocapsa_arctica.AAC.1
METKYLPRFVPDKRKDLCIGEFYIFYDNFLLYVEESAMRGMDAEDRAFHDQLTMDAEDRSFHEQLTMDA